MGDGPQKKWEMGDDGPQKSGRWEMSSRKKWEMGDELKRKWEMEKYKVGDGRGP